ncbi:MAG: Ig-like domain-containing protein, partial [Candidatus Krumholzibacteriia bacterium]
GLTGADGVAVGTMRSTKAELKTVSARVGGAIITNTRNVTFVAGPFSALFSDVQVDKTSVVADGVDAVAVTVTVKDAQENGIAGKAVTIEATGSGNTVTQPVGVTDLNGIAVGSVKSSVAEGKTISARADGAAITKTVGVSFVPGALHHFAITHAGTATAGQASSVTIDARDGQNNKLVDFAGIAKVYTNSTIPGDFITWGLGNAAGSILSEVGDTVRYQFVPADLGDAELRITDNKVESITIYASSGSVSSSSSAPLVVNQAAPDRLFIVSGNDQHAVVNQEVASSLVVGAEDAFGNPVPGVTVNWSIVSDGGYFDASRSIPGQQTTSTTGVTGRASGELWQLGTVSAPASDSITASMPTGSTRSVLFTATADRGPVSAIVLTPVSKSVTVNAPTIVTATLRDAYGNPAANEYVTIFIKDSPDGYLSRAAGSTTDSLSAWMRRGMSNSAGTVSVTYNAPSAAGLADVIDAYHNTIPAGNVVDAVYTTVASGATDLSATVLAGQTSQAGVSFTFRVEAVDGNGNRDLTNTSRIVLDPPLGGGFTFSLTNFGASVTEADLASGAVTLYGRGTMTGAWQISVRDKVPVLSSDQFGITIVPNDTVSSYVVAAPANASAGADFSVSAEARDRFNNRVTTAGYAINFRAVRAADSTLSASGALSVTNGTLVNGLFAGNSFRYTVAEPIRIEVASAVNPVKGYSGVVAVDNALAYQLVKLGGDSTGVFVGDSLRLRARVLDIYGNAVNAQTVFFTVQQGSGHLESPQAVTDAGGAVSLWFRADTIRGTNQVRASILDANPESFETQSFTISTVPRSTIARVTLALPGVSFQAGESFTGDVAAYDQYGNLIDTDSSSQLRCVAWRSTIDFVPDVMTLAAGRSSFSAADTSAGFNRIRVLSLAGDSLSDWSDLLTILPGPAYRIVEVRGDTLGVHVGAKVVLKARVRDAYGNAVPSEIVRFVITSNLGGSPSLWDGTGASGDGLVLTDATGAAVCSLTTDTHAGINSVSASILDANPPALERVVFAVGTSAGTIARFDVLPDGYTMTAGQSFALQLIAYDLNGNEATQDDTSRVNLASSGLAVFSVNPVTLTNGRAAVTVRDNKAENLVLNAQTLGGGALSYSGAITVRPEVPSGAITFLSIVPGTITANGSSVSTITTNSIRDVYGNIVAPGTLVRVKPSLGSVGSEDKDPSTPLTVERQTESSGAVSVFIRSGTTPGLSAVEFQSLTGSAIGTANVTFAPSPACTYAGYLTPRHLVPTRPASFRCSVANGSPTGLNLTTQTSISFADSASNTYEAHLAAAVLLGGSATDTLDFVATVVPANMLGGTYTPRVRLLGNDVHGAPYQVEFNAGSNSVSISNVDIMRVTAPSIVSRGDTFAVDVRVINGGGSVVSVDEIVPTFIHGYFGMTGPWTPPLPDNLPAGTERTYRRSMYVFMNSPLGADTIDASVTASVGGAQVQDASAYPNVAPIFVQSAASIAYVAGSLSPSVVSKGQSHAFSLSLRNNGEAAVLLDGANTKLAFSDGVNHVNVSLGSASALPGNKTTSVVFPTAGIPPGMAAGSYPVSVLLAGTENGASFADTLVLSDPVQVVEPAHLAYRAGSIAPTPVSKRSSVAFVVGVDNTGGAAVECVSDSTWITFSNGSIVYLARLDGTRGRRIEPGSNTLYFNAVVIPDAMPTGNYQPAVRVKGTENGLTFSVLLAPAGLIAVQNPSQLAISSTTVIPSDSVTADQAAAWFASIRIDNNGGATVLLDSLSLRLYAGSREITSECILMPLNFLAHIDSLRGGEGKDIVVRFNDNPAGSMTTGTIVIESTVWGKDRNSGAVLVASTELGGKGSYLVQTPANLAFAAVVASTDTVTVLQTKDWTVDVILRNTGQSDIRLDLSKSFITFSTSADFSVVYPTELTGGDLILEGGSTDTLRCLVDRVGSASGVCRIEATASGVEINSGRVLAAASGSSGIRDEVVVQTQAVLDITRFTALQN